MYLSVRVYHNPSLTNPRPSPVFIHSISVMPNNQKRRKKQRSEDGSGRELQLKNEGQEYALVIKMLGGARLSASCYDGQTRLCHIRGAMMRGAQNRINEGDVILVGLRDYQDTKADVILKYTADDARRLMSIGELPANAGVNTTDALTSMTEDANVAFDFASI